MEISEEDFRKIDTYIISHIEGCWHELKYKTISNINQNITISHLNLDEISCILTSIEDNYGR